MKHHSTPILFCYYLCYLTRIITMCNYFLLNYRVYSKVQLGNNTHYGRTLREFQDFAHNSEQRLYNLSSVISQQSNLQLSGQLPIHIFCLKDVALGIFNQFYYTFIYFLFKISIHQRPRPIYGEHYIDLLFNLYSFILYSKINSDFLVFSNLGT